jgi:hypothetical protein
VQDLDSLVIPKSKFEIVRKSKSKPFRHHFSIIWVILKMIKKMEPPSKNIFCHFLSFSILMEIMQRERPLMTFDIRVGGGGSKIDPKI